ncbi:MULTISPECIES: hypothetical protein [Bacillus]|nr:MULTISPECIES: hypothetical protein [Bacillus]
MHLYYIAEQQRGRGCGTKLHQYVSQFFRAALSFYRKKNMVVVGSE